MIDKPTLSFSERMQRAMRYYYLQVVRIRATPHNIAMGIGLGVFIGALPIIPFQSVVVIALAFMLRTSKFAAWLATCYSNVFTMVPFYYFLFLIGDFVLPFHGVTFDPNNLTMEGLLKTGWQAFAVMLAGGLIFGIPAAVLSYFLALLGVKRYRRLKAIRQLRKRTRE